MSQFSRSRAFAAVALAALAVPSLKIAFAQTSTGSLSIVVTDSTGATLPHAQVSIVGTDTGAVVRSLESNDHGIAEVPSLQPGRYNADITASGFESVHRDAVVVSTGEAVSLTIALPVGHSEQVVTVSGDAPLLETKSDTIAQVVSSRTLTDLPIQGRNYLTAGDYIPGTTPEAAGRDLTFVAYGNSGLQNAFLLDGARNVNDLRGLDNDARDMVRPPIDALQEFTVQTSNFSAEFGASAGAVVNAITKSGTNELHGSAYEFIQNNELNAINYFATSNPLLVLNQYGGSLGGPIRKDHAWLFGAYEGYHDRVESTSSTTVPTALQRAGDFGTTAIYDPSTTAGTGTTATRTEFTNNTIPTERINSIGQELVDWYPLPNDGSSLYRRNVPERVDKRNGVVRGDVQLGANDSAFARYSRVNAVTSQDATLPAPGQDPGQQNIDSSGVGIGYTRIFSPTLVNDFRFSWTSIAINSDSTVARDPIITGSLDSQVDSGTPFFSVSNYAELGSMAGCCGNAPLRKSSGVWDWSDNISKSSGRHVLKTGGEFMLIRPTTFAASNGRSTFGFDGVFTQNPGARSTTGNAVADLLLGDSDTLTTGTVADAVERGWFIGGYVADQWSVTPALTLNLGVRYEYAAPYIETSNHMGDFILDKDSPLYGQLIFSGDSRLPRGLIHGDTNNIAPRIGFAYRVPKIKDMTVRSSYGIFYAQDEGTGVTNRMTDNPPFYGYGAETISSDQLNPSTGFELSSTASIARPTAVSASDFTLVPSATSTLVSWPLHFQMPYVEEWSLSVQKLLPWGMLLEANYVGNRGVQLVGLGAGNQPTVLNSTTVASRRPLAAITDAPIKTVGNWNASNYNGFSAKLEKRFSHGIGFLNSFTYGHAFDIINPAMDLCDTCGAGDTIQNNYDKNANYGSSDNDVRLRYVLTGIWELPFGRGRAYLNHSRVVSAVVGGWALSPVYSYQTGLPFTPSMSYDAANAGTLTRPTQLCDGNKNAPHTTAEWFNTACYVNTTSYTFGNAARNGLRAPGTDQLNLSLQRNFPITRWHESNLNIRLDAFDALNHPIFSAPDGEVGDATYGQITSASNPRQLQVAARYTF
ncbi:carboxypeptidase regulatory-like domain-containing protein [Silvibacterium sp.]|uniref:TonB-dependent receptor n=1 Tax=Silvibacterium sp. TaxID=1964179 RepID=UPI0039E2C4EE